MQHFFQLFFYQSPFNQSSVMNYRTLFSAKRLASLAILLFASAAAMAQPGNGAGALNNAAQTIRSYGQSANTIVLAIGVIVGLVGAIRVYSKWHNGDPDTMKAVTGWFGAAMFLVAVGTVLTAFFG
ncbi:DUF4134 domain-containing protein [Larkinella insperata]|uniref:DUF4134 domain-containing protein n=1 Tax=Larkinella insperata TaxID=332158 RepID=A0ABW3Q5U3_9BACT